MDNNYNKYCSGQLKIISDFDKIQEIFGIVLKNHANNQGTKDIKNFRILDNGCSHDRLPGLENYYKERLLNVLNNRYNELKVGGIFSFNILIQDNQGSENEEKSKSGYCMIKANQILREMSYESIISREEVENMIIPIVHLTRDEYQYAIDKSTNNTGLKLIYENKITIGLILIKMMNLILAQLFQLLVILLKVQLMVIPVELIQYSMILNNVFI
ncbi:hypothetical protein DDB_G0291586 [Dictyostelium discoideum AX4]|uniref:Uncharacterized protein n=1 Tax=Dictyostelium discoideum TaxID=44689 RepID=Q54EC3_DICDI|nr:hypothetical protein DDB_G0291586 [Dictyostelium discoideum AX4]EAL61777.1 hypothetical protein DDB_G0291586 [Dictyostelium discoideum AX4]|eukprot:XP_635317.1 hypothetical protein DDB_G0291586 [Dictyostelium discoideum AX4]